MTTPKHPLPELSGTARDFWDTTLKPIDGWHLCEGVTGRVSSENDDQGRPRCPVRSYVDV